MEIGGFVIQTTIDDLEKGNQIASLLVEERLCACGQVFPEMTSYYYWEGKLTHANEYMILLKTSSIKVNEAISRLKEIHPYTVPEIIGHKMDIVDPVYLQWMNETE